MIDWVGLDPSIEKTAVGRPQMVERRHRERNLIDGAFRIFRSHIYQDHLMMSVGIRSQKRELALETIGVPEVGDREPEYPGIELDHSIYIYDVDPHVG